MIDAILYAGQVIPPCLAFYWAMRWLSKHVEVQE